MVLTARQTAVLQQVANGYLYKQIGNFATVRNTMRDVRSRLSASGTAHAVAIAIRRGLIN